ncbi:arrestin domain-containing protein 3-like [Pleuronectes platessa]|uniref:arrestin domain-containing protein 3-like n=1 Tax=Pleuronectes platessa TaxID=8262 RepID=UPI00232A3EFE|nr:arrestin domain-containing protein 3-like [Pleuronectes platessa]
MTILNFSIEYDAVNSHNTFTNGDTINGRIIVEVSKETKVQSLVLMAQGKARVVWYQHYGRNHHRVFWAKEKYYNIEHHILREARQDGTEVIGKGRHVFPFSFNLPDRRIPSSFKALTGKIVHKLRAELKQSMKLTKKAKSEFTFRSKADMDVPGLLEPQYGSKDKSLKLFGSGNVSMDIHTKRMGYKQGENVKFTVEIVNHSSRSVKPKFSLYEKKSFFAQGRRRVHTKEILKDQIEALASSSKDTVTKVISIPRELPPSILNCSIIKLEYRLKVYLDMKCTKDPEVNLHIVVLPEAAPATATAKQPAPGAYGFEGFRNPTPPTWSTTPQQAAPRPFDPPPPYGAYAMPPTVTYSDKNSSLL